MTRTRRAMTLVELLAVRLGVRPVIRGVPRIEPGQLQDAQQSVRQNPPQVLFDSDIDPEAGAVAGAVDESMAEPAARTSPASAATPKAARAARLTVAGAASPEATS